MTTSPTFDVQSIRRDFPNLDVQVSNKPLVYLDNGATTFKTQSVIDTLVHHYTHETSNVHRAVHTLSEKATLAYEGAREKVKNFIHAKSLKEIIFTSGTTDAINLVAHSFGKSFLKEGDEILISHMEHHSNIVPWQLLCQRNGCVLKIIPMNDHGELIFEEYQKLLNEKTKLVSIVSISNSLGTINPIESIITDAHAHDVPVLIDAAQGMNHSRINVQELDCDFLVFSAHKMYAPEGVGVLYAKEKWLDEMPPFKGGGDMISSVSFEKTTYNALPYKFEAGTPNIAGVIALGAAIDYLEGIDFAAAQKHKAALVTYLTEALEKIKGIQIIGTAAQKASIVSFIHQSIHAHDLGTLLNQEGVAIRTGHHCTEPAMKFFGISATNRVSFAMYNTQDEIDTFIQALDKAINIFTA